MLISRVIWQKASRWNSFVRKFFLEIESVAVFKDVPHNGGFALYWPGVISPHPEGCLRINGKFMVDSLSKSLLREVTHK